MTFYKNKLVFLSIFTILLLCLLVGYGKERKREEKPILSFSHESGFYDDAFQLTIETSYKSNIYYTLDGSVPDHKSFRYTEPILIEDASQNPNVYSMRTDVSAGFEVEDILKYGGTPPEYQVPDYLVDKCTIVRAVAIDSLGNYSDVFSNSYFVGFQDKKEYEEMQVVSIITDPANLFDYDTGIYVLGKSYNQYKAKYREASVWDERELVYAYWDANYLNRGLEWERPVDCQFFGKEKELLLKQRCGARIHGGYSRMLNQKSLNLYARKSYDNHDRFIYNFWGNDYFPSTMTLFQGGGDDKAKIKDYLVATLIQDTDLGSISFTPYVLFLNGEYWGLYWLNTKYDGKYFAYNYQVNPNNVIMLKEGLLEIGEEEDYRYYQSMRSFCSTADMTIEDNYQKACRIMDMDNYIRYYATMIYLGRYDDWPIGNWGCWRVDKTEGSPYGDGRWRWLCFDLNSPGFTDGVDSLQGAMSQDEMFANLMRNPSFKEKFFATIKGISNEIFDMERVELTIEDYIEYMLLPLTYTQKRFYGNSNEEEILNQIHSVKCFLETRESDMAALLERYD